MFYSQSFLARKGPLGTVWCAAHLQHRLRKSHYASTDISSTVDRIMFPEVPIALRLSGHLLLGVVRIYSKKVEYLYHDCNVVLVGLRKAFTTIDLNLPENATTAKFEAITLPQTFDLDALEVDDFYPEGSPDNHLRSWEDITLPDQIPTGVDPYVVIRFDEEDMTTGRIPADADPNSRVQPMNSNPTSPVNIDNGFQNMSPTNQTKATHDTDNRDPGQSNQTEILTDVMGIEGPGNQTEAIHQTDNQDPGQCNQTEILTDVMDIEGPGPDTQTEVLSPRPTGDGSPPEIEVMRDRDFSSKNIPPLLPDIEDSITKQFGPSEEALNEKVVLSLIVEEALTSGAQSPPFLQHSEPPVSAASAEAEIFGNVSPEFALRSSPPVQQPPRRQRKRKNFFDRSTVFTNKVMKKALEDPSDILRKRRDIPSSALSIWKFKNDLRKEQAFYEPSITGLCPDICDLFQKDCMATRPHLILEQEANQEHPIATSPAPEHEEISEPRNADFLAPVTEAVPEPGNLTSRAPEVESITEARDEQSAAFETETALEIERLRGNEVHDGHVDITELLPSPAKVMTSPGSSMPSHSRRDVFTPSSLNSFGIESILEEGNVTSAGTHYSEFETPRTYTEDRFGDASFRLSDIPEVMDSAEAGDLFFLEADSTPDHTPVGSQGRGSHGAESLPVRTRAVAQFLKRQSPTSLTSEGPAGDLSLNAILQGQSRKICARLFFEMLVLKSHGLIDVEQDQPYCDIALKLTTLSKTQL